MDDRTERFLVAYNEIHRILKHICNTGNRKPFRKALEEAATKNRLVESYEHELTALNGLRNVIAHGLFREPTATPSLAVVTKLESIKNNLLHPPAIVPLFQTPVVVCAATDPITKAAATMRSGNFSQIPVYDGSAFVALLTNDTIARWFSACFSRDGSIVHETQVQCVLEHAEMPDNYALLPPGDSVCDALNCILARQKDGNRCDAILITQDGSKTAEAIGIITAFDLPRLYEAIRIIWESENF